MKNTLIDAGPLIALFDSSDKHHKQVVDFIKAFDGHLVTTWPVITEVLHMISFNVRVQVDFMSWIERGGLAVVEIGDNKWKRFIDLTLKYENVPMDLADGSLIILAEEMGVKEVITIDSDFYVYRTVRNQYLYNILK